MNAGLTGTGLSRASCQTTELSDRRRRRGSLRLSLHNQRCSDDGVAVKEERK